MKRANTSDDTNNKKVKPNKEKEEKKELKITHSLYTLKFEDDAPTQYLVPNNIITKRQRESSKKSNFLSITTINDEESSEIAKYYWLIMSLLGEGYTIDAILEHEHLESLKKEFEEEIKNSYDNWSDYKLPLYEEIEDQHITHTYFYNLHQSDF